MKAQLIGYLKGMINSYVNRVVKMPQINTCATHIMEGFIDDLSDLLEFIENIPEENKKHISIVLDSPNEVKKLRGRIRELEENCENDCKVIKNLHDQIECLKNGVNING